RLDLAKQHRGRNPRRSRRGYPIRQVLPEWIELARPRQPRSVHRRRRIAQVLAHRVTRQPRLAHDRPDRLALPDQYPALHHCLLAVHGAFQKRRQITRRGVSFTSARGVIFTSALTSRTSWTNRSRRAVTAQAASTFAN